MRIGLDVRALQIRGGSETRGIGHYVAVLIEGLLAYLPDDRLVLFALEGESLPPSWAERCEVVPVSGLVYTRMPRPWYMRLPKVRGNQALLGRLHARAVASQRAGFEAAVNGSGVDVLHMPTAADVGSYPEGDLLPPVVATFHDAIPLVHREMYYDTWGPFLRRYYDRQLARLGQIRHVVAVSEASRRDAIRFAGINPDRVSVVHPAIPAAYGVPVDAAGVRERYGLPGAFVLFCSIPDPHKNPRGVIEAFARARPSLMVGTRLVLVCPRERPYEAALREAAREFGLSEDAYVITGRIPEEDVVALFQTALCLISPSLIEGFGLPAAQALVAGTPAIVSDRGAQPEVVGDAGIMVDPEDIGAIADALVRLADDPALRDRLVREGRARARLFAPGRQARELAAVYRGVAGGSSR